MFINCRNPLQLNFRGKLGTTPYIIGVTNFGRICSFDSPGIYTFVGSFTHWIENITGDNFDHSGELRK